MSDEVIEFDKTPEIKKLESVLIGEGEAESPMAHAWRYLQVYSSWGVRLPTKDDEFARLFHTENLAEFDFYPHMRDGCRIVSEASAEFNEKLLPEVIGIGNSLSVFAQNAADGEGEMFQELINMVKPEDDDDIDLESAKDILNDMIDEAREATARVAAVQSSLGAFKTELTKAGAKFKTAKKEIDENEAVNDAKIKELTDPDLETSISALRKVRKNSKDDYEFNKNVAATTPTYAWVIPAFPVGLVCAVVVASVYGPEAAKLAGDLEDVDEKLDAADVDLKRALKIQTTYDAADSAAVQLLKHTTTAIRHTTSVQNGWNTISESLEGLRGSVEKTMREGDDERRMKSAGVITVYMTKAGEWWSKLVEPLGQLTNEPYINVEPGETEIAEFAASVRKEAA